jgi:hypothetical protein
MPEIAENAAYVRSSRTDGAIGGLTGAHMASAPAEELWKLLATPQTVESLSRALSKEPSTSTVSRQGIMAALERLLAREMIELSPDA